MSSPLSEARRRRAEGIYIAHRENALGPYTPAEAAARMNRGELLAGDLAARNGDPVWVPLSQLLTPPVPGRGTETGPAPAHAVPVERTHRRWQAAVFIALLGGYCLGAGPRWLERWTNGRLLPARQIAATNTPAPVPVSAVNTPAPLQPSAGVTLLVSNPRSLPVPPPVPAPVVDSFLRGALVLTAPAGSEIDLEGVRVAAYPLTVLEPYLAQKRAQAQTEIERLDPQIRAAGADLAARRANEQAALRAWQESLPADPLRPSLRFAHEAARAAVKTSEDDHRYLLESRALLTGGAFYFRDLPAPAFQTQTNAQGGFLLDLPPEGYPYAVAASVRQPDADGGARSYHWLVKVGRPRDGEPGALRLDRSNLASADAPESLIRVTD